MKVLGWFVASAVTATLAVAAPAPLPAGAVPPSGDTITVFASPPTAQDLVSTADGSAWFPRVDGPITRIAPDGTATEFALPSGASPKGLTVGPDGDVWYVAHVGSSLEVGHVSPGGAFTSFVFAGLNPTPAMTTGADGCVYFGMHDGTTSMIGKVDTAGNLTVVGALPDPQFSVTDMLLAPDGNVWYHHFGIPSGAIGRVTPSGAMTEFSVLMGGFDFAVGPDGAIWFPENGIPSQLGRLALDGTRLPSIPIPQAESIRSVAQGADGALWAGVSWDNSRFAVPISASVVRVGVGGPTAGFAMPGTPAFDVRKLAAAPNGDVWLISSNPALVVGRLSLDGATTVEVSVTKEPSPQGQIETYTADVDAPFAAGEPTGTVQFRRNGVPIGGPVPVVGGRATTSAPEPSGADHTIDATFTPDNGYRTSVARPVRVEGFTIKPEPALLRVSPLQPTLLTLTATINRNANAVIAVRARDAGGRPLCDMVPDTARPDRPAIPGLYSCSVLLDPVAAGLLLVGRKWAASVESHPFGHALITTYEWGPLIAVK